MKIHKYLSIGILLVVFASCSTIDQPLYKDKNYDKSKASIITSKVSGSLKTKILKKVNISSLLLSTSGYSDNLQKIDGENIAKYYTAMTYHSNFYIKPGKHTASVLYRTAGLNGINEEITVEFNTLSKHKYYVAMILRFKSTLKSRLTNQVEYKVEPIVYDITSNSHIKFKRIK